MNFSFIDSIHSINNISLNSCIKSDTFEAMKVIEDKSIDLICTDLPYGVTSNKKDIALPFDKLWSHYERIIKDDGNIVLFGQGLFFIDLVNSNRDLFRYDLIWDKQLVTGHLNAKRQPLRVHEQIAIFYKNKGVYNPQFIDGNPSHSIGKAVFNKKPNNNNYNNYKIIESEQTKSTKKYPKSIISFQKPHPSKSIHRTEKSIELLEWLIKTYSNENDIILDNTAGSFSCAIAAINTNRSFIGIEIDNYYYDVGVKRIRERLKSKLF